LTIDIPRPNNRCSLELCSHFRSQFFQRLSQSCVIAAAGNLDFGLPFLFNFSDVVLSFSSSSFRLFLYELGFLKNNEGKCAVAAKRAKRLKPVINFPVAL
jgi:hypothetical protein